MDNYTWIEFPVWILTIENNPNVSFSLRTKDFILIAHLCNNVDQQGRITDDDLARVTYDLDYEKDLETTLDFLHSNNILINIKELDGTFLNYADKKQGELLLGRKFEGEEEKISRAAFPLELTQDKLLNFEDFRFLAFCFEFSKIRNGGNLSFIDAGAVQVFSTKILGLGLQNVRDHIKKLEQLGYVKMVKDGLKLLPEIFPENN